MTVVQSQDEVRRRGIKLPGSKRFEPPRRCEPEFPVRYPERGTACPELSIEQLGLGNDFERWHQHLNYALLLLRTHSGYGELDSSVKQQGD